MKLRGVLSALIMAALAVFALSPPAHAEMDPVARGMAASALNPAGIRTFANMTLQRNTSSSVAPELNFVGLNGSWLVGVDVANNGGAKDFVPISKRDPYDGSAADFEYVAQNGLTHANVVGAVSSSTTVTLDSVTNIVTGMVVSGTGISGYPTVSSINSGANQVTLSAPQTLSNGVNLKFFNNPTMGLGVTPPTKGTYTLQVSAPDSEPPLGDLGIRVGQSQTGDAISIYDSTSARKWWVDKDFYQSPTEIRDTSLGATDLLGFNNNALTAKYAFVWDTGYLRFNYLTGGVQIWMAGADGTMYFYHPVNFSAPPVTPAYPVSGLPSASSSGAGARALVTDATACTFASTPTGGGSTKCPVVSTGSAWIEG